MRLQRTLALPKRAAIGKMRLTCPRQRGEGPQGRGTTGPCHEIRALARDRLQELLRRRGVQDRARPHRRRRPERLRQVEPRRGAALGDGRKLVQGHARLGHGRRHLLRLGQTAVAQQRRGRHLARQFRPSRAGRLQRARDDRGDAPHRARGGLDLSRQRPRGARPRRAASVRRRLDRRALARARPPGPDRRDHRRQAPGAAAASSKRRPAFPACIRAATRRSCASRGPRTIFCASRTCSSRSTPRSRA